jgi:hypothetical protein
MNASDVVEWVLILILYAGTALLLGHVWITAAYGGC